MKRWLPIVATALLAAGAGIQAEAHYLRPHPALALGDALVGWSFIATGLVARERRPTNRSGLLMILVGFLWFVGNLRWLPGCGDATGSALVWTLGAVFQGLYAPVLLHLLLGFPEGRLSRTLDRWTVGLAYAVVTVVSGLPLLFRQPSGWRCAHAVPGLNLLLVAGSHPGLSTAVADVSQVANLALSLWVLGLLVQRWRSGSVLARRYFAPVLLAGGVAAVGVGIASVTEATLPGIHGVASDLLHFLRDASLGAIPFGFLAGLLRSEARRSAVGDLVVSLGESGGPASLRAALATALRDPSLRLGYWAPSQDRYVDEAGRAFALPEGSDQVTTYLTNDGSPMAVLVHDKVLEQMPRLVAAATAAAKLSLDNERLHAEVRAQLVQVRASRARIVEAGDAERRRLERDLHDGAQQRLVSMGLALRLAREQFKASPERGLKTLDEVDGQLRLALAELRDLARGIHPAVLTQEGLGSALHALAERSACPVSLTVPAFEPRLAMPVEAAAYFFVSEALANVGKHARASRVTVSVGWAESRLVVEVADDGVGGADIDGGSGIRGLEDRVAALGGAVMVQSSPGKGTRLVAEIPCGS